MQIHQTEEEINRDSLAYKMIAKKMIRYLIFNNLISYYLSFGRLGWMVLLYWRCIWRTSTTKIATNKFSSLPSQKFKTKRAKKLTLTGVNELLQRNQILFNTFGTGIFLINNTNIVDDDYYDNNDPEKMLTYESPPTPPVTLDPSDIHHIMLSTLMWFFGGREIKTIAAKIVDTTCASTSRQ